MAKPIIIVKADLDRLKVGESQDVSSVLWEGMTAKFPDYHVMVVPFNSINEPMEFQVFYEKDFTDTTLEELRKLITDTMAGK